MQMQSFAGKPAQAKTDLIVVSTPAKGWQKHAGFADLALRPSDALLLQGARKRVDLLARDSDFVVLSAARRSPLKTRRAPFAIGALLLAGQLPGAGPGATATLAIGAALLID